jgi:uncharacterized damage-inducible protein DinB
MKKAKLILSAIFAIVAVAFLVSFRYVETDTYTADDLKQKAVDWERAKAYTQEYINASTDEIVKFKPTAEMRTFGQQMLHIAEANYGLASMATGKTSPVAFGTLEKSDKYTTKAELMKAVMDSYDFVIAATKEMDPKKLGETVTIFKFDMSRDLALQKVFEHQTHHRGQTTVYLRLKGVKPPDEKLF